MKKLMLVFTVLALLAVPSAAIAGGPGGGNTCRTIQDGGIVDSIGNPVALGYDQFGYNYQSHMFNGRYCDYDRVIGGVDCDVNLVMKWNDAWLSNQSCDTDGKLDRHFGFPSYIGSGAWTTNHMSGSYVGDDGKEHPWTYFVKIVAKPTANYDCAANGGIQIWGDFCEIQSVYNDPYSGYHGLEFKAARPGLGDW